MAFRWLTQNWAETGAPGDPPPLELTGAGGDGLAFVQRVVSRLPRWRVERIDVDAATIHATCRTRVFRFIDDVTIRVETAPPRWRVHVRSKSRVGVGDLGQNRRNILELFAALTREQSS